MNNIWLAFITGVTTGGLSCFAVQGGLLASSLSQDEENKLFKSGRWQKVIMFITSKLLAYTLVGVLLGLLGSAIAITPTIQGWLQIFAGVFMVFTAIRLLDIYPFFRRFTIQPPKWAYKLAKSESKSQDLFAPALLGFLTVLLPCGTTQAMMVLAISSGNPFWGAMIMFAFILGTSPIFFALGMAAQDLLRRKVLKYVASIAIVFIGLMSINTGQVLRASPHTVQNYWSILSNSENNVNGKFAKIVNGKQEVKIVATSNGYLNDVDNIKSGVPVKLTLESKNVLSCARSFLIPSLGISKILPQNGETIISLSP
ncbi:sulfite exporter TauE/SafE family protein, partial [Candidatus Microgenomates bacterium]|nr:sulfite exporter TauE/SafE family protein [Candidatus Microgenomates bacterium]